jgi:hypothetical protein
VHLWQKKRAGNEDCDGEQDRAVRGVRAAPIDDGQEQEDCRAKDQGKGLSRRPREIRKPLVDVHGAIDHPALAGLPWIGAQRAGGTAAEKHGQKAQEKPDTRRHGNMGGLQAPAERDKAQDRQKEDGLQLKGQRHPPHHSQAARPFRSNKALSENKMNAE